MIFLQDQDVRGCTTRLLMSTAETVTFEEAEKAQFRVTRRMKSQKTWRAALQGRRQSRRDRGAR